MNPFTVSLMGFQFNSTTTQGQSMYLQEMPSKIILDLFLDRQFDIGY